MNVPQTPNSEQEEIFTPKGINETSDSLTEINQQIKDIKQKKLEYFGEDKGINAQEQKMKHNQTQRAQPQTRNNNKKAFQRASTRVGQGSPPRSKQKEDTMLVLSQNKQQQFKSMARINRMAAEILSLSFFYNNGSIKNFKAIKKDKDGKEIRNLLEKFLRPMESVNGGGPSLATFKLCRVSKGFKNAIFSFYREEILPISKRKYVDDAKLKI